MASASLSFIYGFLAGFFITWGLGESPAVTITAIPGSVVKKGQNLTLRCEAEKEGKRFCFLIEGTRPFHCEDIKGKVATVTINNTKQLDSGSYYCTSLGIYEQITTSTILPIWIIDLKKPILDKESDPEDNTKIRFRCTALSSDYQIVNFFLLHNTTRVKDSKSNMNSLTTVFSVFANGGSIFRCSYQVEIRTETVKYMESPQSDPVLIEDGRVDEDVVTQITDTGDGRVDEGVVTRNTDTDPLIPIISSVSALVVLICVLIIACCIIRKHKNSKNNTENCALPLDDKPADVMEPVYFSADEHGKESYLNAENISDDKDEDGITYAILNTNALKKKNVSQDVPVEDVSVYALVKTGTYN
ncbi:immunoglobulin superfamily member 1 [Pelobates cultripes]|nr:immunoglobulin superfamily member 1 [Pelobates cultripes]